MNDPDPVPPEIIAASSADAVKLRPSESPYGEIFLFPDPYWRPRAYRFAADLHHGFPDLSSWRGIDQKASSLICTRGTWALYMEKHYEGDVALVEPGTGVETLLNWGDRILSIRCIF